jgi:hypothetical protein
MRISVLLIVVGRPCARSRPETRLEARLAFLAFERSISAVSSPQMQAPAPSALYMPTSIPLMPMFLPSRPAA